MPEVSFPVVGCEAQIRQATIRVIRIMAQWFRLYATVLHDEKVQQMSSKMFKSWINVLCFTAQNDGKPFSVYQLSFALRKTEVTTMAIIQYFVERGLLDEFPEGFSPHNWSIRQFKSDSSTERVKRFRNAAKTVTVTPSEQSRNRTEQNPPLPPKGHPVPELSVTELQRMIDAIPGIKPTKLVAPELKKTVEARLREHPTKEFWEGYCREVAASDFLCGRKTDFQACLSWLCGPKNMAKVLAGNYTNHQSTNGKLTRQQETIAARDRLIAKLEQEET